MTTYVDSEDIILIDEIVGDDAIRLCWWLPAES